MTERAMTVDEQVSQIRRENTRAMQALREGKWVLAYEWLASADSLLFDLENAIHGHPMRDDIVPKSGYEWPDKKEGE
jgi:hypothetical protein